MPRSKGIAFLEQEAIGSSNEIIRKMTIQQRMLADLEQKIIFDQAQTAAYQYLDDIDDRDVYPSDENISRLDQLQEDIPESPGSATEILTLLHEIGSLAAVNHTGGRYFGFVIGGATPVSLAAKWLTTFWDQCGGLYVLSPINAELEVICEKWLKHLLGLPKSSVAGFVSGASMANFSAIAAARYQLLKQLKWDVNSKGLYGAPHLRIITHNEIHASIRKTLILLGFGDANIEYVSSDKQGRMVIEEIPKLDNSCLIILQAGNVNTGAFDHFNEVCDMADEAGAWVHIDGAFGLWAAASKKLSHLTKGIEKADSWTLDAHKTLNVPYDSGIVICKHPEALANALQARGDYLIYSSERRDPMLYTPEMSKRSRAIELWVTLKYLGKQGLDEMVTGFHLHAAQLAKGLKNEGFIILNQVVFNQVLVALKDEEDTRSVLTYLQQSGKIWLGDTTWNGKAAIRISVSSWRTTKDDVNTTIELFKSAKKATEVPKQI